MKIKRKFITCPRLSKKVDVTSDTIRTWIKRGYIPAPTHPLFEGSKLLGYTTEEVDAIIAKVKGRSK